jgi:hypothetical protein
MKYNGFVLFLPFLSFPFLFLITCIAKTGRPIFAIDGLNAPSSAKEVPFWGWHFLKIQFRGNFTPKIPQNKARIGKYQLKNSTSNNFETA